MKLYLFVLGRDPELSKIEIESFLESKNLNFEILDADKNIAVIKLDKFENKLLNSLGGVIKIAEVISNTDRTEDIEDNLNKINLYSGKKNKIIYSVSGFKTDLDGFVHEYLKEYFKDLKIKAMFKKEFKPSSSIKRDLLNEGLEIVIYKNLIGRVVAVSDPLELKRRDLGRPSVEHVKTISLRLAKILINLSKARDGELLLDPFCGNGTILQEALLRNINVIGVDNDVNSIKQSKDNLEWLKKNYNIKNKYNLIKLDARKISSVINKVDAVVTEPYMGPYIRKLPTVKEAHNLVLELSDLYSSVLKQAKDLLISGKRIVIVIPRFRTREGKNIFISIESLAKANNFILRYKPIIYAYKESKLIREICVLEKL